MRKFLPAIVMLALLAPCTLLAQRAGFQDAKKADTAPPQASVDLVARARRVLDHYYALQLKSFKDESDFKSSEAWEAAAKIGDFKTYKDFEDAVAAQRKADPTHFPKLYDAMSKEVQDGFAKKLDELEKK